MNRAPHVARQLRWMPRTIFDRRLLGIEGDLPSGSSAFPLVVALLVALVVELLDQFI